MAAAGGQEMPGRQRLRMEQVDAYAAAAGPGSFTGVRVGLTSVKAWAEVYGKRIAAVSRLEALAAEAPEETAWVAAFFNAQRGQVFGRFTCGMGRVWRDRATRW